VRCVIGTLPLAIQTNALIEEPLVRVPVGWSAIRKLRSYFSIDAKSPSHSRRNICLSELGHSEGLGRGRKGRGRGPNKGLRGYLRAPKKPSVTPRFYVAAAACRYEVSSPSRNFRPFAHAIDECIGDYALVENPPANLLHG
jgi:hypothetical protein